MTLQLGILASGTGSNALAIIRAAKEGRLDADVRIVIANRPEAPVLQKAAGQGITALCLDHEDHGSREEHDAHLVKALHDAGADTAALAGYMRLVSQLFLDAFPGRVLNLRPTLLPGFGGVRGTRECVRYGAEIGGCMVYSVEPVRDGGPIIIQAALRVR